MEEDMVEKEPVGIHPIKILLKGAGLTFCALLIGKVVQYFFRLLIARQGAEEYGIFSLGFTVFSIVSLLAFIGMTSALVRFIPEARSRKDDKLAASYIRSAFTIVTVSSLFFALVMFLTADMVAVSLFHDVRVAMVIQVLAFAIPFYAWTGLFVSVAEAYYKNQYSAATKIIGESIARLLFTAVALWLGFGLFGISFAFLLSVVIGFVFSFYFMEFKVFSILRKQHAFSPKYAQMLAFSIPVLLSGAVYLFINWTDSILLGVLRTVSEVGIYNTALPTASLLLIVPSAATTLFTPVVVELLTKKKREELGATYKAINKWILIANLLIFFVLALYARQVIRILYGSEYELAAESLVLLSIGNLIYSVGLGSGLLLISMDKPKLVLKYTLISAFINVSANMLLIPPYGITGAAFANMFSNSFYCFLCAWQVKRLTGFWPLSYSSLRIMAASAIAAAIPYFVFKVLGQTMQLWNLVLLGMAMGAIYVLLLLILRTFDRMDFDLALAIERKAGVPLGPVKNFIKRFY